MSEANTGELYALHAPAARRLALALAPPHEADDLVAESFTRVLAAVRSGREPRAFRPYLMTTVRNQAADAARGRHRLVSVPDPEPPPAPSAAELAGRADEARRARAAFDALPDRWRAVLWATEVEGSRPAQLTGQFGLSANGVAQLAVRAREGLREAYLAQHIGPHVPEPCRSWTAQLPASARSRLPALQQARLEGHLRRCRRCSALSAELAELNTGLGALIGPVALASAAGGHRLLASVLGAGYRKLASVSTLAVVGSAAMLPLVMSGPASPAPAQSGVIAVSRAGVTSAPAPARSYAPRHAKSAAVVPVEVSCQAPVVPAAPASTAPAASSIVQQAGDMVTGTAGSAVGTAVSAAAQAGQAADDVVSGVAGSADQLVSGVVTPVAGTVTGLTDPVVSSSP